jgi:hypothetical protein
MLRFVQFIKEMVNEVDWSYGHPPGSSVKVNNPSHPDHAKTGKVVRQLGHEHGVDLGGGKLSWHRTDQLTPVRSEDFNDDVPVNPRTTPPPKPKEEPKTSFKQRADAALAAGKNRRGLAIPEMVLEPNPKVSGKPLLRPADSKKPERVKYYAHPSLAPDPEPSTITKNEGYASIGPNMTVKTGVDKGKRKVPYFFPKLAPAAHNQDKVSDMIPRKQRPDQVTPAIPSTALKSEDVAGNTARQLDPNEGKHSGRGAGKTRLTPHNPNMQRDGWGA